MFDATLKRYLDPALGKLGESLAKAGIGANSLTCAGLAVGIAAMICIAFGLFVWGLILLLVSRLFDGLDGAVARATRKTDFGGYLDIVFDFIFYGAIPLGFAIYDPQNNALPAAVLLLAFYANGASFLAFATMAEKHGLKTVSHGSKSLYYTGGLAEAGETIGLFVFWCILPDWFEISAYLFAGVTAITTISRLVLAYKTFGDR